MRVVLLGPPGAGKGTHAAAVARRYGMSLLATGDVFRDNVRQGTPLGMTAKDYLERGELVPDDIVIAMVTARLDRPDVRAKGFLLDGFPRSLAQAAVLEDVLACQNLSLDVALRLVVPDAEIVSRVVNRRSCPDDGSVYHLQFAPPRLPGRCDLCEGPLTQRPDDTEQVVRTRLQAYAANAEAVDQFYAERGLLRDVVSVGPLDSVAAAIRAVLDAHLGVAGSDAVIDISDGAAGVRIDAATRVSGSPQAQRQPSSS